MKTQSRTSTERAVPSPADEAPIARTGTLPVRSAPRGTGPAAAPPPVTYAPEAPEVAVSAEPARGPASWLTLENGLYLLFFVLAIITHFWDLGVKGLHHDESLHSVYSWKYYTDLGYIHSPMMHGPEQFHFIDLAFLLFGATDATARFASATCGVFLVMAPWFLRRQLGRWPALAASFLILISPSFMYFTRFAREDSIYAAMEMLFVLGLWRFVDERKPRDFYVLCAGYSLMFTIKESAYLTTAVVGLLLVGLFAWQMGSRLFSTFLGYLVVLGAASLFILKMPADVAKTLFGQPTPPALPKIPDQDPSPAAISSFVSGLVANPLIQVAAGVTILWLAVWGYLIWDQSRRIRLAQVAATNGRAARAAYLQQQNGHEAGADDVTRPLPAAAGNGTPAGRSTAALAQTAEDLGEADEIAATAPLGTSEVEDGPLEDPGADAPAPLAVPPPPRPRRVMVEAVPAGPGLFEQYQPGSLPYALGYLFQNVSVLLTGLGIALLLYVALYTSMFTNINGIGTGMFGSIGYWLAQQDVRRGDQPWFYYFVLIPIYEPLILFFGFTSIAYFVAKGVKALRTGTVTRTPKAPVVPGATAGFNVGKEVHFAEFRPFLVLFLIAWFVGATALYCWAGEKMPWLMIHMVQPIAFLAALSLGQLVKSMIRNRRARAVLYVAPALEAPRPAGSRKAAPVIQPVVSPWFTLTNPTSWVPFFSFLSLFLLLSVFWAMNITHRVMNDDYANWWQLLIWPALLLLLAAGYWSLIGGGRVLRYVLTGILMLLSVYGIRSAIQLSFYNASDAREMAVYVQTTPDTVRAADTIDRLSIDQTGARDLKVAYDSLASWPWEWYLRDYKNKQFMGGDGPKTAPAPDVAVLVVDSAWYDKATSGQAPQLANYVGVKYPMRWWFPEDTYRNFVPSTWDELDPAQPAKPDGSPNYQIDAAGKTVKAPVRQFLGALDTILYTLRTPAEQGKLWKYLVYRQPYAALGSTDMAVFVRRDLVDRYNYLASLNLPNYDNLVSH